MVSGSVTDSKTGEPIAGCSVYLEDTEYGTSTRDNGYYRIDEVPPGDYTLIFSMIGYTQQSREIQISQGSSVSYQNAGLSASPIQMPEVQITSRRMRFAEEVTASAFSMDREAFKHTPVMAEQDLFRTLMALPGVSFASDFTSALYVRGGSPDQNLVLLDNMVLYNPFHFGGFLSTFMIDAVQEVQFLTGGFPVQYGNRLSAVLDVESAKPRPVGGYLSSSLLATEGAAWGKWKNLGGMVTARRTYFDKVIPIFTDFEFPYYFYDVHATVSYMFTPKVRLQGTFFNTADKLDLAGENLPIEVGWKNRLATAKLIAELREPWVLKTWAGWSHYDALFRFSDLMDAEDVIDDYSLRASLLRPGEKSSLQMGAEGSYLKFIYKVDAEPFATYDIDGRPEYGASFFSWKYKPGPLFLLQAGTRLAAYHAFYPDTLRDSISDEVIGVDTLENFYLEPQARVSGKYFLTADDALSLSAGNFFQNLGMVLPQGGRIPTNFWIPVFGKYQPQHALHFIAGYEHLFEEGSRIRVEPYYKHYLNLLAFNDMADISDMDENIFTQGAGRAYGADFSIEKASGKLTGWISYSLAFSSFISDTAEFYTSFDRRHNLNVLASYDLGKGWRISGKWTFASGLPYAGTVGRYRVWYWDPVWRTWRYQWVTISADRNTLRFPPYHRLDLGASKTWEFKWGSLSLRADLVNVYNQKNVMLYYYDMSSEPPVRREVSMIPIFPSAGIEVRFK